MPRNEQLQFHPSAEAQGFDVENMEPTPPTNGEIQLAPGAIAALGPAALTVRCDLKLIADLGPDTGEYPTLNGGTKDGHGRITRQVKQPGKSNF